MVHRLEVASEWLLIRSWELFIFLAAMLTDEIVNAKLIFIRIQLKHENGHSLA